MIIRVQEVLQSTWSNSEDKPQLEDSSLIESDYYDAEDRLHLKLSCDHESYHVEAGEADTMRNGEHDTYTVYYTECDDCGEALDIEPDFDEPDDYDPDR